jgi:hypothetical protein
MARCALMLLGLTCFFAAATAQAPLPPQDVPSKTQLTLQIDVKMLICVN